MSSRSNNLNVVFTGPAKVVGLHITRDKLSAVAVERGNRVQSMVTKDTDFVVCSDVNFMGRKGRKLAKADELGVKCISALEFINLMNATVEVSTDGKVGQVA